MKKNWLIYICLVACPLVLKAQAITSSEAVGPSISISQILTDAPTETDRNEERARLNLARQTIENQYNHDMRACYQKFDVNSCRIQARDRRIEANALLRKEQLRFNAQERQIHASEVTKNLAERKNDAEQKNSEAQRASASADAKERADANAQKQMDHALRGTRRGEYEQRQREAVQHRADVEKKMRERKGESAAPLPAPAQ